MYEIRMDITYIYFAYICIICVLMYSSIFEKYLFSSLQQYSQLYLDIQL